VVALAGEHRESYFREAFGLKAKPPGVHSVWEGTRARASSAQRLSLRAVLAGLGYFVADACDIMGGTTSRINLASPSL